MSEKLNIRGAHTKKDDEPKKEPNPYKLRDHYASEYEVRKAIAKSLYLSLNPYNPKDFEEDEE